VFGHKRSAEIERGADVDANDADDEALLPLLRSTTSTTTPAHTINPPKGGQRKTRAFTTPARGQPNFDPGLILRTLGQPRYDPLPHPSNYVDDSDEGNHSPVSPSSWSDSSSSDDGDADYDSEKGESEENYQRILSLPHVLAGMYEKMVSSRPGASSKGADGTYNGARLEMFRREIVPGMPRRATVQWTDWEVVDVRRWREGRVADGEGSSSGRVG
jgi:hypothetical protein